MLYVNKHRTSSINLLPHINYTYHLQFAELYIYLYMVYSSSKMSIYHYEHSANRTIPGSKMLDLMQKSKSKDLQLMASHFALSNGFDVDSL